MPIDGSPEAVILIVDDNDDLRELTAAILAEIGYRVIGAANGDEALSVLAADGVIDLLFTDIRMPGMHGFELARRAKLLRPDLKILYATAHTSRLPAETGPRFGPLLKKPWRLKQLADAIRTATEA
jgi:CheY-like chemotaxis protein